jgi:hypothetical protein
MKGLGSEQVDHKHNYPKGGVGREQSPSALLGRKSDGLRRMWEGGPLRQFSKTQAKGHYVAYSGHFLTGYAGSYVCDQCRKPCAGIYYAKACQSWLCGGCRK